VIYSGIAPDKLYTSLAVYGEKRLLFPGDDKDRPYTFIEAFNENGISTRSATVKVK